MSNPDLTTSSANGGDWEAPTTVAQRLGDAVQLLCNGKRPPEAMVAGWLDRSSEELQSFCADHGPAWAQGIGLIDAAMVMVDQPTEITTPEHQDRDHEHRAPTEAAAMAATVPGQPDIAEALGLDGSATTGEITTAIGDLRAALRDAEEAVAGQPAEPSPADLRARIQELEEQLQPYLEAEAKTAALSARRDRAEQIATRLFPEFHAVSARQDPSKKPPQWHEKSWWWNGAKVHWDQTHLEPRNGTIHLHLSSYVGGGSVEDIGVNVPAQWLDADDWHLQVDDFIAKKVTERTAAKAATEAAEAQRQITAAQATLARLAAPKGDSNG